MKMTWLMALTTLFLAGTVSAQTTTTGTVSALQVDNDGSFSFALTGNPVLCNKGNGNITNRGVVIQNSSSNVTQDGVKALYATILTAYTSGRTVTVYTTDAVITTGWGCTVYALDLGTTN